MPATVVGESTRNRKVPTPTPTSAQGSRKRSSFQSTSRRKAAMPSRSMTSSSGIMIAAACGTVQASAINGTASEPKPAPKPLLLRPMRNTAGAATA